ncbi:hypothetical protein DENSPDRAFT_934431 [Dentipellis sp. KUC8613]|nr:hypothetical protein DENSPDRAFT_934431 [Dentipellis sp. KUC8613]
MEPSSRSMGHSPHPARRLTPCRAAPRTSDFCHTLSTPPRALRAPWGCLAPRPPVYTPGGVVSCTVARCGALSTPATPSSHTVSRPAALFSRPVVSSSIPAHRL